MSNPSSAAPLSAAGAAVDAAVDAARPLCLYHGDCIDGFAAAWVVHNCLEVECVPVQYGSLPPAQASGRDVLIVDFSYPRATLELLRSMNSSVLVLDHHKTAQEDLRDLGLVPTDMHSWGEMCDTADKALGVVFDMERSGAGLAWDFFHPGKRRPALINFVEDRDLWKFELEHTRAVHAALASYPFDFRTWDGLADETGGDRSSLVIEGQAIDRRHLQMCHDIVRSGIRLITLDGRTIPVCNANFPFASDIGNIMSEDHPFAATYCDLGDGRTSFSLRSRKDGGADVSEIAKKFGGGGHKNAAGFTLHRENAREILT